MSKDKGWISIYRKVCEHWIYQCREFDNFHAYFDLLRRAHWEDKKVLFNNNLILIKRGQFLTSEKSLAESWGWSRTKVRKFLQILSEDDMIIKESDNKKTIITICNYDKYQKQDEIKEHQENNNKAAGQQHENTKNNIYNINNLNNINNTAVDDFISTYNAICCNHFKNVSIEKLSAATLQKVKIAILFLNKQELTAEKYFKICISDNFLKSETFTATFNYLIEEDKIENILSLNNEFTSSNSLSIDNEIYKDSLLTEIIKNSSSEATQTNKKNLISRIKALREHISDDEIRLFIHKKNNLTLTTRNIYLQELLNEITSEEAQDAR